MRFRDYIFSLDYSLILLTTFLFTAGAMLIYSSTTGVTSDGSDPYLYIKKQLLYIFVGLFLMFLMTSFDFSRLRHYALPFFLVNIALLTSVLFIGRTTSGAQRWIDLGFFSLQPSEFAKFFTIIVLAAILATKKGETVGLDRVGLAILALLPSLGLTLVQPDLGTSLVLISIFIGMLFASGVELRFVLIIALIGLILIVAAIKIPLLKPYQLDRLTVFLNPEGDPRGAGYNLLQSQIAIGSGRLTGKGLSSGSQTVLGFVPEHHTDFIFSVLGEKMGFIGSTFILLIFLALMMRGIRIAMTSRNTFGMLLCTGIVSMLAFQVFVNVGMTIGIMPITGIPLPFVSAGGSSLLTTMMCIGLMLNVAIRKFRIGDIR